MYVTWVRRGPVERFVVKGRLGGVGNNGELFQISVSV